jgi:hypothetical protein
VLEHYQHCTVQGVLKIRTGKATVKLIEKSISIVKHSNNDQQGIAKEWYCSLQQSTDLKKLIVLNRDFTDGDTLFTFSSEQLRHFSATNFPNEFGDFEGRTKK